MMLRCYSELLQIPTFKERYEYLRLDGVVGEETFGFDRYLNQIFYNSQEWKDIRRKIIIRDNGCDLGLDGYEIRGKILCAKRQRKQRRKAKRCWMNLIFC